MAVHYDTFLDDEATIVPDGDDEETVTFDTDNVNTGANASLDYRVTPNGKTTLIIELNDKELSKVNFDSGVSRVLRENFAGSHLNKDNTPNTLKFRVTGDSQASITLSDGIVFWKS
jgi:hypothetical protein